MVVVKKILQIQNTHQLLHYYPTIGWPGQGFSKSGIDDLSRSYSRSDTFINLVTLPVMYSALFLANATHPSTEQIDREAREINHNEELGFIINAETLIEKLNLRLKNPDLTAKQREEILNILSNRELINREVIKHNENSPEIVLLRRRAEFNLVRNASIFNDYLPYRHSISNDSKTLVKYEELVNLLKDNVRIRFATIDPNIEDTVDRAIIEGKSIDPSIEYLTAASIVDLFHGCPELINSVICRKDNKNLKIYFLSNKTFSGSYYSDTNTILVNTKFFSLTASGSTETPFRINPVPHEFVHALDGSDGERKNYFTDGIIGQMSPEQKKTFTSLRNQLFNRFRENIKLSGTGSLTLVSMALDKATGLPLYAFTNEREFLATTVIMFYTDPAILRQASPELYNLYKDFFKCDPITFKIRK